MRRPILILALTLAATACKPKPVSVDEAALDVLDEEVGYGRPAETGEVVTIDYRLLLPNGEELMAHSGHRFVLGHGTVIAGVDEAVEGMRTGGRRVVSCPPHKHWGREGYGDEVPPNTTLELHVKLRRVEPWDGR